MNDRGFTLIEVIAIDLILVSIFFISFPIINNTVKSDNEEKYNQMVDNLCIAGKTYMYSNLDNFPELSVIDSIVEVKISELILYGSVNKNTKNPNTDLSVEDDVLKYKVLSDYSLECTYIDE